MIKVLVSFAITCRNLDAYIGECIESVLCQRATDDYEVIVVDDASTDTSDKVIRSFQDPRIRYLRHTNRLGEVFSVNEAFAAARGMYVVRVDGDDRLRPDFLQRTLPILERFPEVGLVYGDCARIDANGEVIQDPWQGLRTRAVHGNREFKGDEYLTLVEENVVSATSLMRRSALQHALPIPSDFNNSDWYVNLRIARQYELCYVAATLFDYRIHGKNRHLYFERERAYAHTVLRILDQVFSEPDRKTGKEQIRNRVYGKAYRRFADAAFGAGEMGVARRYYVRALRHEPHYLLRGDFMRHWLGTFLGAERYNKGKALILGKKQGDDSA